MGNFKEKLASKRKEFGRNLVLSLLVIFLLYIFLFLWLQNTHPYLPQIPISVMTLSFVTVGYVSYLFSKTTFSFKTTYTIVAVSFFCFIFYLCMLLCHVSTTCFYFYLPLLLLILITRGLKTTVFCAIVLILLCVFTPFISDHLNIAHPAPLSPVYTAILPYLEWLEVFVVSYLCFFMLNYYTELKKIEIAVANEVFPVNMEESPIDKSHKTIAPPFPDQQDDKLDVVYQKIIDLFETEKPYQHPDFNVKKLADLLETNTTYVSKALNRYGGKKFSTLVNEYRITQVKEELAQNIHLKFTLEYVYSRAGYTKQPTFNRVFKEQTGVTPSEYIEKHKKKNAS